ncbi:MAG: hypothetical protein ACREB3_00445 [Burkholderiales bacterium]
MNLKHLGDALDHWKGSVIELIGEKRLRVLPMLTDQDRWTSDHFNVYARLLRLKTQHILRRKVSFPGQTRSTYFSRLREYDLFVDPDTGIASDKKRKKEHISPAEIASLLPRSSSRLLLIYQQRFQRKEMKETLKLVLSIDSLRELHRFAYDAGAVGMVFISRSRKRINGVLSRVRSLLGPVACVDGRSQLPGRIFAPETSQSR